MRPTVPTTVISPPQPLAIIGLGCRFPGGAHSPKAFWELLRQGQDAIVDIPPERWDLRRFYDPNPDKLGKMYVRSGGFLRQRIDQFDALFFGMSPREALCLDPQQRLLLEVAWEALEDAGIVPEDLAGSETGVFIGAFTLDNQLTQMGAVNRSLIGPHSAVSSTMTILANRLSYTFDWRGPSVSMDTACSSSLVAFHYACQSLWNGECTMALAGGVNVIFRPEYSIAMCKGQFLSPDGRCKSFDERANGYGRGEGAGVVLLKPLSAALQDGDTIAALVRGTGVNQDGRTNGITVPNQASQEALIRRVCAQAAIDPAQIRYVEAHGTGTPVGDPIEARALGAVLGQGRTPEQACVMGSVKANIGHLEAASGIAGLIKLCLCLRYKQSPPLAHLGQPNPHIPFAKLGLRLPREVEPLVTDEGPLFVSINSFGYGGTNAHAILQEPPRAPLTSGRAPEPEQPHLLVLSTRSEAALTALTQAYLPVLEATPSLTELCAAASQRRGHYDYRLAVVGRTRESIREQLQAFADTGPASHLPYGKVIGGRDVKPVFVFTGMGPQWWAMGRELWQHEAVFRQVTENCDAIFSRLAGWSILTEMLADKSQSRMTETGIAQPANFVLQAGLTALWRSWGIEPAAIVGHSVGEVTAAYVAGVLDLEEALRVSWHRSRLQQRAAGQGAMLAVGLTEEEARAMLVRYEPQVSIAAANSPTAVTLAGDGEPLQEIAARLEVRGVFHRFLQVEVPYHSHYMEALKDDLCTALDGLRTHVPGLPLYSTVTGQRVTEATYDAAYWCDNIREPVLFARAMGRLIADGATLFLEVGPHPVLSTSIKECLTQYRVQGHGLFSLRREQPERHTMLQTLGALYTLGADIAWKQLSTATGRSVELPHYPWQRETYWQETPEALVDRLGSPADTLPGRRLPTPGYTWERPLNANFLPYLEEHRVENLVVLPGAAYVEAGLAIHQEISGADVGVLEDLEFHRALLVEERDEPLMRCTYDATRRTYAVYSAPAADHTAWTLHASGRLSFLPPGTMPPLVSLEAIQQRCAEIVEPAAHYRAMQRRGLYYGPSFQGIRHMQRQSGEVLAQIEGQMGDTTPGLQYRLHPTLLDACFQALLATMEGGEQQAVSTVYVPSALRQVRFYAPPTGRFWCHGSLTHQAPETITGDLTLCDTEGHVLVEVRGLRCQALSTPRDDSTAQLEQWTYAYAWQESPPEPPSQQPAGWLVFLDASGVGERLVSALQDSGAVDLCCVTPGDTFSYTAETGDACIRRDCREDMQRLLQQVDLSRSQGVVYLWGLDAPAMVDDAIGLADSLTCLYLMQVLEEVGTAPRLYVVTRGLQQVSPTPYDMPLAQAALVGLARVAYNEYPQLRCTLVDLDPDPAAEVAPALVQELLANSVEDDVALRDTARYVHRMMPAPVQEWERAQTQLEPVRLAPGQACRLAVSTSGRLDSRHWCEDERREPGPGEVEIAVQSVALHTSEAFSVRPSEQAIVLAVTGVVTRVGDGVTQMQAGETAVACLQDGLRSYATVGLNAVFPMPYPQCLDPAQAATLPMVYATAYYALHHVARLQAGETVLIHAAATGVGLAALQIARWLGAKALATADTPAQRDYLRTLGITVVMEYRSLDFAESVMAHTSGRGVDVIVNTRTGDVAHTNLRLLAPYGRCLELGPCHGEGENHPVTLPAGSNITVASVNIGHVLVERPALFHRLLQEVWEQVLAGAWPVPVVQVFPAARLAEACQTLTAADHIGTVVLSWQEPQQLTVLPQVREHALVRAGSSYLISGGLGGFGLLVAAWLVAQGARHLVLVGRHGAATAAAHQAVADLQCQGVQVLTAAVDITQAVQVGQLLAEVAATMPPLAGIVHAAAVLDDAPLTELNAARWANVIRPKALGAWHLHQQTLHLPLDFFVLFSSLSCLIGNARQGNYVAANAFLDALAQQRRAQGLPATSINWGALAEVGMASSAEVEQHFQHMGIKSFTPAQATAALARVLRWHPAQVGVMDVDWKKWGQFEPIGGASPRFRHLTAKQVQSVDSALRQSLLQLAPAERPEMLAFMLAEQVAMTLRLPTDGVEIHQSPVNLGMDSLMAVELQNAMSLHFGIEVSTLELMKGSTLVQMAEQFVVKMGLVGEPGSGPAATGTEALPARQAA